jgi:hypothetical protein
MKRGIFFCFFLYSFYAGFLCAQKVLYSPFVGNGSDTRFEVIGKAGNYYWIQKSRLKGSNRKPAEAWLDDKELRFEVYDARMNLASTIPFTISADIIKEYLIAGDEYFDQLVLQTTTEKIFALLNRYTPDGNLIPQQDTLAEFPHHMKCGDFLLVRSQDRSKILLLGFETVIDSPSRLHALLYDKDWKPLCQTEYSNIHISKPLVQYDLIDYPLEDYNSDPIKLANSGEWMMVSSGISHNNYLLFHFAGNDEGFVYKEIKLPSSIAIEETGLYFDNEKQEGFAGILSSARTQAIKNVKLVHYSLNNFKIDFDTSYVLNTLAGKKVKNENIFEEYFMTVPGKGFLLLKEYGRTLSYNEDEELKRNGSFDESDSFISHDAPKIFNKDEYTRYDNLAGTRNNFDRGDLSLYYFPAKNTDSCWSGIINKQQMTELGKSYLSYVFLPRQDKLFFLYNSMYRNSDQYSSTTVLDQKGNPVNEGVEYWQMHDTMVFQKARQISETELAIPYERNARNGFAIIHL